MNKLIFVVLILASVFLLLGCTGPNWASQVNCEDVNSVARDKCYYDQALEKKDLNICSKAGVLVRSCILDLDRIAVQDSEEMYYICATYGTDANNMCTLLISEQKQDANVCRHLFDNPSSEDLLLSCLPSSDKALTNDINLMIDICGEMKDGSLFRDSCFIVLAEHRKEPSVCENISAALPSVIEETKLDCIKRAS